MRLTGFRDGRYTIIARRTSDHTLAPIGKAEEFWADPYGWLARADEGGPEVDTAGLEIVPAIRPSSGAGPRRWPPTTPR